MSFALAQVVCLLLMTVDMIARTWRIVWLLRGIGQTVTFADALILNVFGDAAAAVTPARLGGEPARFAGLLRAGVPPEEGVVAISYEVVAAWPVVIGFGAVLTWAFAPEWLATTGPAFLSAAASMWPWLVAVGLATVLAAFIARRVAGRWAHRLRRPARRLKSIWRRMPPGPLLASVPMTLVNLAARTAILPVLAMTLVDPPAMGPVILGAFVLLYSQLVLPTPAGIGGVEFGFLAGAAGNFGAGEGMLLLLWRFYTVGLGAVLGGYFLVRLYGWPAARRLVFRGRTTAPASGSGAAEG
jgi:uncharacterized membrane protein YbhN (UPF0104 family)